MAKKSERIEKADEDIYDDEQREEQLEEDEIMPEEAAFVEGYESPEMMECANCGKGADLEKMIEKRVEGETRWFCSQKCIESFEQKKKAKKKKL